MPTSQHQHRLCLPGTLKSAYQRRFFFSTTLFLPLFPFHPLLENLERKSACLELKSPGLESFSTCQGFFSPHPERISFCQAVSSGRPAAFSGHLEPFSFGPEPFSANPESISGYPEMASDYPAGFRKLFGPVYSIIIICPCDPTACILFIFGCQFSACGFPSGCSSEQPYLNIGQKTKHGRIHEFNNYRLAST